MKFTLFLSSLLALADASAIVRSDDPLPGPDTPQFKTKEPHFFHLKVDDSCKFSKRQEEGLNNAQLLPPQGNQWKCPLAGYAIRLENGIVVATPYQKWYDPKLATFFVDDDTQLYTVSKEPLQLYIDSVTGAFKYTKLGWLPPSAISTSFYHTGNNPLGLTNPSPSYLSWPSTVGIAFEGQWAFCPLGETGQFQVFVNNANFAQQGVHKNWCKYRALAAVNANPWQTVPSQQAAKRDMTHNANSEHMLQQSDNAQMLQHSNSEQMMQHSNSEQTMQHSDSEQMMHNLADEYMSEIEEWPTSNIKGAELRSP